MDTFRQIATSFTGSRIALSKFETTVLIFDLLQKQVLTGFDTILDFGGQRLAISEDGQICICGAWERYGICAYDTTSGKLLWQRKDLKKPQYLRNLRADARYLFVNLEYGASRIIDIQTGEDIARLPSVNSRFDSPYHPFTLLVRSRSLELLNLQTAQRVASIARKDWHVFDVAFTPASILIADGRSLNCYDLSGKPQWEYTQERPELFQKLCYHAKLSLLISVSSSVEGHGGWLKYIDPVTGQTEKELTLAYPHDAVFALNGELLITPDQQIINLETGTSVRWA